MALEVNYGPVGLLGAIAGMAGQREGAWKQAGLDMQATRMTQENIQQANQIAAQDRAHQLQAAMASKMAVAQKMTPAAEHVSSYLEQQNAIKQHDQTQSRAQLDDMLNKGSITPEQYGRAVMGLLSGSKGLMDKAIMPPDTTDPMQKPIFAAKLQMIRDQRAQMYDNLKDIRKAQMDVTMKVPDSTEIDPVTGKVYSTKEAELMAKINKTYTDEQSILSSAAPSPPKASDTGTTGSDGIPRVPGTNIPILKSANPADQGPVGSGYIATPIPGASPTEQNIMSLINKQVGPGIVGLRGQYPSITRMGGPKITPDIAQQLLQETGGDKDRARQLAQQRGYDF